MLEKKIQKEEPLMANKYEGTQTYKNLEAAFAGESMARNKYTYFASKAKKEGFEQISALFLKTAENIKIKYPPPEKKYDLFTGRGKYTIYFLFFKHSYLPFPEPVPGSANYCCGQ